VSGSIIRRWKSGSESAGTFRFKEVFVMVEVTHEKAKTFTLKVELEEDELRALALYLRGIGLSELWEMDLPHMNDDERQALACAFMGIEEDLEYLVRGLEREK
jgi:hypothetical protein